MDAGVMINNSQGGQLSLPLDDIVAEVRIARERWRVAQHRLREVGGRELPSREALNASSMASAAGASDASTAFALAL